MKLKKFAKIFLIYHPFFINRNFSKNIGITQIQVKNYKSAIFKNSVDDKLAISYLVHNEN